MTDCRFVDIPEVLGVHVVPLSDEDKMRPVSPTATKIPLVLNPIVV